MPGPLRVAIVEDDALLRDLLARSLAGRPDVEVTATCADGAEAIAALTRSPPDAVLLDLDLGDGPTGLEVARALGPPVPPVAIVLLSNHRAPQALTLLADLPAGGLGYLLKGTVTDLDALVGALHATAAGRPVVDPALARGRRADPGSPLAALTPRRLEVLALLAEGHSNAGIARRLAMREKTVENQINAVYAALGLPADGAADANRRVRAALRYLDWTRPTRLQG